MGRLAAVCLLLATLLVPTPATADGLADEAARQVNLAKDDFATGAFERAVAACNSALRLDPSQREAFKIKGFALEQLGQEKEALGMLRAWQSLSTGLPGDPAVDSAIERLEAKLEVRVSPAPAVLGMGGAILGLGGFGVAGVAFLRHQSQKIDGVYFGTRGQYQEQELLHVIGLTVGGTGAALAIAGIISGAVQAKRVRGARRVKGAREPDDVVQLSRGGPPDLAPVLGVAPTGVSVGVVGRW